MFAINHPEQKGFCFSCAVNYDTIIEKPKSYFAA